MRRPLRRLPGRASFSAMLLAVLCAVPEQAHAQALPSSSMAVLREDAWQTWWEAARAPWRWPAADAALADAVDWRTIRPGLDLAEIELAADGIAWRLRVALVRLDPRVFRLQLADSVEDAGTRAAWSVDATPASAALAVNAGQFTGGLPWGWVVTAGREVRAPGIGPLSMAFVIDTAGGARLVPVDSIAGLRGDAAIAAAFQSYPALLRGEGVVPEPLRAPGRGVDVQHRDSRLALGELRDGRLLIALTRFGGLGPAAAGLPFGPTTPEMAALMGALGCREAMLLDGGLSGQLVVRDERGRDRAWKGWRRVPLALVALPRATAERNAP